MEMLSIKGRLAFDSGRLSFLTIAASASLKHRFFELLRAFSPIKGPITSVPEPPVCPRKPSCLVTPVSLAG
jgi:hypothetical protein